MYVCFENNSFQQGGGRSSARETVGRVAAGAVAKKILELYAGIEVIDHLIAYHYCNDLNTNTNPKPPTVNKTGTRSVESINYGIQFYSVHKIPKLSMLEYEP